MMRLGAIENAVVEVRRTRVALSKTPIGWLVQVFDGSFPDPPYGARFTNCGVWEAVMRFFGGSGSGSTERCGRHRCGGSDA